MKKEKIKNISKIANNSKLYDIETKNNHNFFANGILVHNSSFTAYLNNDAYGVCSRNLELKLDAVNNWTHVSVKYEIEQKLRKFGKNIALQGEIIGPGIQGNKYNLTEVKLKLFDIFDIDKQEYFNYDEFIATAKELGLPTVDYVHETLVMDHTVRDLVAMADLVIDGVIQEGLVFRPKKEIYDHKFGRVAFKVINEQFLLNEKD